MYTAYQLANRVNTEYPNNGFIFKTSVEYNTQLQQGFIDLINSSLSRADNIILLDDIYEFPTIAGQALYELPTNCEQSNVKEITREYGNNLPMRCRWAREGEIMEGNRYFNGYGNTIGLFPVPPVDGQKITVFFKRTPRKVIDEGDPIEVKDKYIDMLVYFIVSEMASSGSNPDIEIANNYIAKYNAILEDAKMERYGEQPYYPQTKDNQRPPLSYLRRG